MTWQEILMIVIAALLLLVWLPLLVYSVHRTMREERRARLERDSQNENKNNKTQ